MWVRERERDRDRQRGKSSRRGGLTWQWSVLICGEEREEERENKLPHGTEERGRSRSRSRSRSGGGVGLPMDAHTISCTHACYRGSLPCLIVHVKMKVKDLESPSVIPTQASERQNGLHANSRSAKSEGKRKRG